MDAGRVAAEGSPRGLIDRYSTPEGLALRFTRGGHEEAGEHSSLLVRHCRPGPAPPAETFAVRELRHQLLLFRRTWRGTLFSSLVNPLLYLAALGAGLGSLVNHHAAGRLGVVSYLAFIAPGLLAATAMQIALGA